VGPGAPHHLHHLYGRHCLENIAPYRPIDLCFAACDITPDLEAILCAADLKKLEEVSAYNVPKPSVGTESDVSVRKCVLGDENDIDVVNHSGDNKVTSHFVWQC